LAGTGVRRLLMRPNHGGTMLMYRTLDGELTCECCTRKQCDGEISEDAPSVQSDEPCSICGGADVARKVLADFAAAAAALNALWQLHCDGSAIDRVLCEHYPQGWSSFDEEEAQIRQWSQGGVNG
jgi:hypothetical protein